MSAFGEILLIVALVLGIACSVAVADQLQRFVGAQSDDAVSPCSADTSGAMSSTSTPIHEHSFVKTFIRSLSSFEQVLKRILAE